jgi:hypothetical protein
VVEGGSWASHLFVVNPSGDISLRGLQPSDEQKQKMAQAWLATANESKREAGSVASSSAAPARSAAIVDYAALRKEIMMAGVSAATGNAEAVARMQAFAVAMGGDFGSGLSGMPNAKDFLLARQGDRAAIARLRALHQEQRQARPRHGKSGLQTHSFLSFHPPLAKRAKRLQKMGATMVAPERGGGIGLKIFMFVLYLIIVPLLAVAGGLMLVAIAMMIGLNLLFLTLWLTVIHWAFGQDWGANYNGFMKFLDEFIKALNRLRR